MQRVIILIVIAVLVVLFFVFRSGNGNEDNEKGDTSLTPLVTDGTNVEGSTDPDFELRGK